MDDMLRQLGDGAEKIQKGLKAFGDHILNSSAALGKDLMAQGKSEADEDRNPGSGFMDSVRGIFDVITGKDGGSSEE